MTSLFRRKRSRRERSHRLVGGGSNRSESRSARRVRDRRNMILSLYFGFPIMFLGVTICVFNFGFDRSIQVAIGMLMILASYGVVLLGCSYWLRAKGWDQAVLLIGLLPILCPFLPGFRLAIRNPVILFGGMVFMSMLLAVVIFSLPNRS